LVVEIVAVKRSFLYAANFVGDYIIEKFLRGCLGYFLSVKPHDVGNVVGRDLKSDVRHAFVFRGLVSRIIRFLLGETGRIEDYSSGSGVDGFCGFQGGHPFGAKELDLLGHHAAAIMQNSDGALHPAFAGAGWIFEIRVHGFVNW
jgi:hypothetical protein